MPYAIGHLVAVDPILLFVGVLLVALVFFWDGEVYAWQTPLRRRLTVAAGVMAGVWFWVPRGDFWWIF